MRMIPVASLCALLSLTACATIRHGPKQIIGVSSSPTNANVFVDGQLLGSTPFSVNLDTKKSYVIRVELDGYMPFQATIDRRLSGWVWGNIVFGGLIGFAIDAATGSIYRLSPEQLSAQLSGQSQLSTTAQDHMFFILAPAVESSWEKVGQMVRE